jgi:hypothetical protein
MPLTNKQVVDILATKLMGWEWTGKFGGWYDPNLKPLTLSDIRYTWDPLHNRDHFIECLQEAKKKKICDEYITKLCDKLHSFADKDDMCEFFFQLHTVEPSTAAHILAEIVYEKL